MANRDNLDIIVQLLDTKFRDFSEHENKQNEHNSNQHKIMFTKIEALIVQVVEEKAEIAQLRGTLEGLKVSTAADIGAIMTAMMSRSKLTGKVVDFLASRNCVVIIVSLIVIISVLMGIDIQGIIKNLKDVIG